MADSKEKQLQSKEDDIVIQVKDVKKHFKVYPDKGKTLKDKVLFHKRNRFELREVLKGISFEVKRGEAIGLIGKNGCGKSTTLKLLTKILRPNSGEIIMKGRVSSLIELGAGFHPDLTGRENIYINASIFGIKAEEVDRRLDDIIRFSELEEFIDNPVRTYSSGMYMRLAFSVAINVDADILLIDEILAVGDMNFQEKCFNKLQEIKRNGTTIVIVSHAQGQIEKICDRVVWIDEGEIRDVGDAKIICKEYKLVMEGKRIERARFEAEEELAKLAREEEEAEKRLEREKEAEAIRQKEERERKRKNLTCREICKQCGPNAHREGDGRVVLTHVSMNDGKSDLVFGLNDEIKLKMVCESTSKDEKIKISVGIFRNDYVYCFGTSSQKWTGKFLCVDNSLEMEFSFKNKLLQGEYFMEILVENENGERLDAVYNIIDFRIENENYKEVGIAQLEYEWNIK